MAKDKLEKKTGEHNNGHKPAEDVRVTDVKAAEAVLNENSFDTAFKSQEVLNAIRMLILSDPTIMENAMRYTIPSRQFAVAAASWNRKCKKHHYDDGISQLMETLGLMTSVRGERINKLVTAVVGERNFEVNKSGGLMDKIKGLYGDKLDKGQ